MLRIFLTLFSILIDNFLFLFSKRYSYQNIYCSSNLTKWRLLEPFINSFEGPCILFPDSIERRNNLISRLEINKIKNYPLERVKIGFNFWSEILNIYRRQEHLTFYELIHLTRIKMIVMSLFDLKGNKKFFFADDDFELTAELLNELKLENVKTILLFHGRVYDHFYDSDLTIGFCKSQLEQAKFKNKNPNVLVSNFFKCKTIKKIKSLKRITFYDQPAADPFYPHETKNKILEALNSLKKHKEVSLQISSHPLSSKKFNVKDPEDLALTACSTIAWDNYSKGIPTLMLNFDNILENFAHLEVFKFFSATSGNELLEKIEYFIRSPEDFENETSQFFKTIKKNIFFKTSYKDLIGAINSL